MDTQALSQQRMDRIMKAVRHEKPDRTPLMFNGNVTFLKYFDPSATSGQFVRDPLGSAKKIITNLTESKKLQNIDSISGLGMWPGTMGSYWMCKIKLPGRELDEDALWQLDEQAFMTEEDYDKILDKGWKTYYDDVIFNRLGYTQEDMEFSGKVAMESEALTQAAGYPAFATGGMYGSVVDKLTSARGTVGFFRDIRRIPDKLMAVINQMMDEELVGFKAMLDNSKPGSISMITPPIRLTCDYVSQEVFDKYGWPTMYKAASMAIDAGMYVYFHMDSNWDDFLHYFKVFPKKRIIYDSDGQTDIYKIKEILGDSACITGNVSPSLLSLGTPEEVYKFCRKQIEDMGDAYILNSACSLPPNAKPENLDAMNAAVEG